MLTLNQGWFCLPGEIWQWSETVLIITTVGAIGIWLVEAKDADKHVSMQRTAPLSKELSSQKCHPCWGWETLHSTSIQEFAWKIILQLNQKTTGVNKSTDAAACFFQGKSGHEMGNSENKSRTSSDQQHSCSIPYNTPGAVNLQVLFGRYWMQIISWCFPEKTWHAITNLLLKIR